MTVASDIDTAVSHLKLTTSSYTQMVKKYGSDTSKWPSTSQWSMALASLSSARKQQLKASFTYKET